VRGYFRNPWNVLDFLVSWGSVPSIFVTAGPAANVLRTLRIARVLTLLRRVPSVRRLMVTIYLSAPTISNLLLLITLMIYTFAVLGVNLFYGINSDGFDKFLNWSNVGSAMMMLAIVATGDWDK
jgi:voltage-gated sodium channel